MGLTQSGVSHIIAAVEAEVNLPLLKRTRKGARLTPEGEKLIPFLREIMRQEKLMMKEAERMHELVGGTIRIARSPASRRTGCRR